MGRELGRDGDGERARESERGRETGRGLGRDGDGEG